MCKVKCDLNVQSANVLVLVKGSIPLSCQSYIISCFFGSSYEEAGRYLETYKSFENKPPDMLMERIDSDFFSRVSGGTQSLCIGETRSTHVSCVYNAGNRVPDNGKEGEQN